MPSALETLVKILKLEREQGYSNTAVIGGLASFSQRWVKDAHQQARKPEHHLLVDELEILLRQYEGIESKTERHERIQYMMDRITGRVPPPPDFQPKTPPPPPPQESAKRPAPEQRPERPARPEPQRSRQNDRPERERQGQSGSRDKRGKSNRGSAPANQPPLMKEVFSTTDEFESSANSTFSGEMDIPAPPRLARPPRSRRPQLNPEEATDILRGLRAPVTVVKGVGERMQKSFDKLNVQTVNDLLRFYPRDYDDYTRLLSINRLRPNEKVVVVGTVQQTEILIGRNNRKDFKLVLDDGTGLLNVVFYGQYFMGRYIKANDQIVLRGQTSIYGSRLQIANPEWEHLDPSNLQHVGIVPIYPLTEGLKAQGLRRLMKTTVDYWAERLPDYVPESVLDRTELADLGWALRNIHFPEGMDHLGHARNRLVFDELLLLQLSILSNRRD